MYMYVIPGVYVLFWSRTMHWCRVKRTATDVTFSTIQNKWHNLHIHVRYLCNHVFFGMKCALV